MDDGFVPVDNEGRFRISVNFIFIISTTNVLSVDWFLFLVIVLSI